MTKGNSLHEESAATTLPISGPDTLAQVRGFLLGEIVPAVPAEIAGEVRAIAKLLRTVEIEFRSRSRLVGSEVSALLTACAEALDHIRSAEFETELSDLQHRASAGEDAEALHCSARSLATRMLVTLQRYPKSFSATTVLDQMYALLGEQAEARLNWQAVFATPATTTMTEGTHS